MTDLTKIIEDWRGDGGLEWPTDPDEVEEFVAFDLTDEGRALIAAAPDMVARIKALEAESARLREALVTIRDAHPTGLSWSQMRDGTWREVCRDFQRIARAALTACPAEKEG